MKAHPLGKPPRRYIARPAAYPFYCSFFAPSMRRRTAKRLGAVSGADGRAGASSRQLFSRGVSRGEPEVAARSVVPSRCVAPAPVSPGPERRRVWLASDCASYNFTARMAFSALSEINSSPAGPSASPQGSLSPAGSGPRTTPMRSGEPTTVVTVCVRTTILRIAWL